MPFKGSWLRVEFQTTSMQTGFGTHLQQPGISAVAQQLESLAERYTSATPKAFDLPLCDVVSKTFSGAAWGRLSHCIEITTE